MVIVKLIQIVSENFIVVVKRNNKLSAKYFHGIRLLDMNVRISLVPQVREHGTIEELFKIYNFQSLVNHEYGDSSFSFLKN